MFEYIMLYQYGATNLIKICNITKVKIVNLVCNFKPQDPGVGFRE